MISSISCLCQVYQQPAKISPEQHSHLGCRLAIFRGPPWGLSRWHVRVEQHVDSDHIPWGRHSRWLVTNRLKHNAHKTELLWTGSNSNLFQQGLSLPVLQLGPDLITHCDHVRLLPTSVLPASTGYGSLGASDYPWTYNRLRCQFTHLCRHTS